jgi:hypothetical protein
VRRVFADTLYWLAIFVPGDEWTEASRAVDLDLTGTSRRKGSFGFWIGEPER